MISISSIVLSLALAAAAVQAQSIPSTASAEQLAVVAGQYNASGYNAADNTGFGVPLSQPEALVSVAYSGAGIITNGSPYQASAVNTEPRVYLTPAASVASQFGSSNRFTVMLADAGAIGAPDPRGNYRHYLANGISGAAGTGGNTSFALSGGNVITNYAGPGPAEGEGPHRYAWLVFAQPSTFTAPSNLSAAGTAAGPWNVSSYVSESGLGPLVGAAFFTVENGQATYSVLPTSAVSSVASSLYPTAGASSSGGASPSRSSGAATPSGTGAASVGKTLSFAGLALGAVGAIAAAYL